MRWGLATNLACPWLLVREAACCMRFGGDVGCSAALCTLASNRTKTPCAQGRRHGCVCGCHVYSLCTECSVYCRASQPGPVAVSHIENTCNAHPCMWSSTEGGKWRITCITLHRCILQSHARINLICSCCQVLALSVSCTRTYLMASQPHVNIITRGPMPCHTRPNPVHT